MRSKEQDKGLALMVYETWLLNGATVESMPKLSLRRWCNRQIGRPLFPVEKEKKGKRRKA